MPEAQVGASPQLSGCRCLSFPISVTLDAYPGKSYRAQIVRVYPEVDRQTRHRLVEAKILDKVNLASGMFARITVSVESVPDAFVVPSKSVLTTPSGEKILRIVKEGKAVRVKVTTGIAQGERTQIMSGIQAGDQVIVVGQESVKDGAPVKIVDGAKSGAGEESEKGGTKSEEMGPGQKGESKS
jgi:membrane fusion protein (multidrug efflux system)